MNEHYFSFYISFFLLVNWKQNQTHAISLMCMMWIVDIGELGGSSVVPGTEYAYSPAYPQYSSAYSSYGYSSSAGGLLSK